MDGFFVSDKMKVSFLDQPELAERIANLESERLIKRYVIDWEFDLNELNEVKEGGKKTWDLGDENKYTTAWQAATNVDRKNAKRLFDAIRKIDKKAEKLVATIEPIHTWCDVPTIVNACIVVPMLYEAMGADYESFFKEYTQDRAILLMFILSNQREGFLASLKDDVGNRIVGDIQKKVDAVFISIERLKNRLDDGFEGWSDSLEVLFWIAEYSKRRCLMESQQDAKFRGLLARLRDELREVMGGIYSKGELPCDNCPFDLSPEVKPEGKYLFIYKGLGCIKEYECRFAQGITRLISSNLSRRMGGYIKPDGFEKLDDKAIKFCLDVSKYFGIYVHECYSIWTPEELLAYLKENKRYPLRGSILNMNKVAPKHKASTMCKKLTENFKSVKATFVEGNYSKLWEERLVGLYLWDQSITEEENLSTLIKQLMNKEWYKGLELGRKFSAQFEAEIEKSAGASRKDIIDRHREYVRCTEKSIERQKVLPLSTGKKGQRKKKSKKRRG